MSLFEEEMTKALARKEPSPGFAQRVLQAAANEQTTRTRSGFIPWLRGLWLAPVAAVLIASTGIAYRQHLEREQGLRARQQLLTALKVTGRKIQETRLLIVAITEGNGDGK